MRDYFEEQRLAAQEREFAPILRLMAKALGPKPREPRLLLTKSIASVKRKSIAPKKPVLLITSKLPTDRELVVHVSDAVARGLLSGTDGLEAQKTVDAGGKMPKGIRAVLLSYLRRGGR